MPWSRAAVLCCCILVSPIVVGSKLTSIMLKPAPAPAILVGQQILFDATGSFSDGSTRLLGGMGNPMLWHVLFPQPQLRVASCGADRSGTLCCQVIAPDAGGAFNATWGADRNVRAVGSVSPTSVLANLSCVSGPGTGSLSASWNGTFYSGGATFDDSGSVVAVKGLTWSSSNPSVASVDDRGIAAGNSVGTATIRATFGSTCWPGVPETGDCSGSAFAEAILAVEAGPDPPPDFGLRGTYEGTWTATIEACHQLPAVTYSGGLTMALLQTGSAVTGVVTSTGTKHESESAGQCSLVDDPDPEVARLAGQTDGATISGMVVFPPGARVREFTAAVSGDTIRGLFPGEVSGEGMVFRRRARRG